MNWKTIIQDLAARGMTQDQIAEKCGVSQPYISALLHNGRKNPSWPIGQKIVELHRSSTSEQAAA